MINPWFYWFPETGFLIPNSHPVGTCSLKTCPALVKANRASNSPRGTNNHGCWGFVNEVTISNPQVMVMNNPKW